MRKIIRTVFLACAVGAHVIILCAAFFAPYAPTEQHREFPLAPPVRLHFRDARGNIHLRPFVYLRRPASSGFNQYQEDRTEVFFLQFFVRTADSSEGICSSHWRLFGVEQPANIFLLGTDGYGRDEFSRLLFGGQISLFTGLLGATISVGIGTLLGLLSGYYGAWVDDGVMGAAEVFLCVPWLYLLLIVRALLPLHMPPRGIFVLLVTVLGLVGWARPARLIRGVVLSAKRRDYVAAARGFGASDFYLLRVHVLPSASGVIWTQLLLYIPQYVLAEATLSFFGLGVSEPVPSWGNMLTPLQQPYILTSCWWMFAPAAALMLVIVAYQRVLVRYVSTPPQF